MTPMVSGWLPVLVSVTGCAALVVPTVWLPKVRLVGATETDSVGDGGALTVRFVVTVSSSEVAEIAVGPLMLPAVKVAFATPLTVLALAGVIVPLAAGETLKVIGVPSCTVSVADVLA